MKKVVCFFMVLMIVIGDVTLAFAGNVTEKGFSYDTSDMTVTWKKQISKNVYTETGDKLGTLTYVAGVGKYIYASEYVLMIRMVVEPNDKGVKISTGDNYNAYGYSEYVSVDVVVPGEMGEYTPTNTPTEDKVSLNVGFDATGASVNASYDIESSDLEIVSRCSTSRRRYWIEYDYIPSTFWPFVSNKYVANESVQMGMVQFNTSLETFTFSTDFVVKFGANRTNDAISYYFISNYLLTKKFYETFTFKLK